MSNAHWNGPQAVAIAHEATMLGLERAGEHVRGVAVNLAPIERGDLRNSAAVSSDDARTEVAVSFDTPYAVRQHEELDYHHDVGQAKYLESALNENADQVLAIVAASIRRALR